MDNFYFILFCLLFTLGIYFFPSIVASERGTHNRGGIFLINLLLGWTIIGWIIALFMAGGSKGTKEIKATIPENQAKNVLIDQLERLAKLKNDGVLTEEEFSDQKAGLLNAQNNSTLKSV